MALSNSQNKLITDLDSYVDSDFDVYLTLLSQVTNITMFHSALGESESPGNISRIKKKLKQPRLLDQLTKQLSLVMSLEIFGKNNKEISEFELFGIIFKKKSSFIFSNVFINFSNLVSLNLSRCIIPQESMINLLQNLKNSRNLVQLSLSECNLTDESGQSLISLIHHINSEAVEDLWANGLRNEEASSNFQGLLVVEAYNNISLYKNDSFI